EDVDYRPVTGGSCTSGSKSPRKTTPASSAPAIGATQKSHSCCTAQPPTNSAGPVLRAGFTEVLVTGMLIKWMRVRQRPMAQPANPTGERRCVSPSDTAGVKSPPGIGPEADAPRAP